MTALADWSVPLGLLFVVVVCVAGAYTYGDRRSLHKPVIRPMDRQRWERLWIVDEQTPGNQSGRKR